MKEIELTKGYVAIVDDDDYEWLSQYKWNASISSEKRWNSDPYVSAKTTIYKVWDDGFTWRRSEHMPRMIMNAKQGEVVDHINHVTLDNRKENLRVCSAKENGRNSNKQKSINGKPCTSIYKGATLFRCNKGKYGIYEYWRSQICVDGNMIYLGQFKTEEDAALAYNDAALKYHGDFARLNEIAS